MNYAEARASIRSGQLLAWTHRPWRSWYDLQVQAVRVFTRSEFCHVGIAWRVAGRLLVLEAVRPKVRIFPLSLLVPFYYMPLEVSWTPEVESYALGQVGKPYSRWQAVLAGMGKLKAGEDESWQCAEYAQAVLARAGVGLPGLATPSNLVDEALRVADLWKVSDPSTEEK